MNVAHSAGTFTGCGTWQSAKQRRHCQFDVHSLFSTSDVPFLAVDVNGTISDWSPHLTNLLNFTKDEICGFKFMDLITTDVAILVHDMIDKARTSFQWMRFAIPLYTKDARKLAAMLHVANCAQSDVLYIVIQPLVPSLDHCKATRFSTLVKMPACGLDTSGRITDLNIQMTDLSGFTMKGVIGLPFLDLCCDSSVHRVQRMLRSSMEKDGTSSCRITFYTLSAIPKFVRMYATAVRDTSGHVVGVYIVIQQIAKNTMSPQASSTGSLPSVSCSSESSVGERDVQ